MKGIAMKRHARIIAIAALLAAVFACSGIASAQYINGTTLPPATGPTPDETCLPMGSAIGLRWSYCDVASGLFSFSQVDMTVAGPNANRPAARLPQRSGGY